MCFPLIRRQVAPNGYLIIVRMKMTGIGGIFVVYRWASRSHSKAAEILKKMFCSFE